MFLFWIRDQNGICQIYDFWKIEILHPSHERLLRTPLASFSHFCLKIINTFCHIDLWDLIQSHQFNNFCYFQPEKLLYLYVEFYWCTLFRKIYFGQQLAILALVGHQSQLCFFCFEAGEKGKKVWRESFECIDTLSANWEIPKSTELTFLNTTKLA